MTNEIDGPFELIIENGKGESWDKILLGKTTGPNILEIAYNVLILFCTCLVVCLVTMTSPQC